VCGKRANDWEAANYVLGRYLERMIALSLLLYATPSEAAR
jgi:hypothetical protein